ncbi:MAG: ATP-binding protein [Candidatus Sericytochromatia bacterium]|nr:ATP-binding protein [Candidatus Sericytochromatia bacterium]
MIPGTRAFMVVTVLELEHTVLQVCPALEQLESLEAGASFSIELRTDATDRALHAAITEFGEVGAVAVEAVEEEPTPPVFTLPAAAHDRLLAGGPGRAWIARVRLEPGCAMPEARAALVVQALQGCAEVVQSQLTQGPLWLLLWTDEEEAGLRAAIAGVAEVRDVALQAPASLAELVVRAPEPLPPQPGGATRPAGRTVRVCQAELAALEALAGRLLAAQQALRQAAGASAEEATSLASALHTGLRALTRTPAELLLARYPRMVRELGHELGKEAELSLAGQDVMLDAPLAEGLGDVLVHLLRNAVDHGLEGPEERRLAGKPTLGTLRLAVRQEPDALLVTLADDGRGLDPAAIRQAAVRRGRLTPDGADALTADEVVQLVFEPGFSTREVVSRVSGRGVGLDAVRHKVVALGGSLALENRPGRGLVFKLHFPTA